MNPLHFDELKSFHDWWLGHRRVNSINGPVTHFDGQVTETLLFRSGQYQVEHLVVAPDTVLTPHGHPNVDSFEVYVAGDLMFDLGGETFTPTDHYCESIRVPVGCLHGGRTGPRGGVFLSIQRWTDGVEPTFISKDWDGQECRNHTIEDDTPTIRIMKSDEIMQNWDRLYDLLDEPIRVSDGEETHENVQSRLMNDLMLLAVVEVKGEITMAFTLDVVVYGSGLRELSIPLMGGTGLDDLSELFMPFVTQIAKDFKCGSIVGYAVRKGWSRKLKNYGWKTVREIIKYRV